jgi:hypothetical protein
MRNKSSSSSFSCSSLTFGLENENEEEEEEEEEKEEDFLVPALPFALYRRHLVAGVRQLGGIESFQWPRRLKACGTAD